MNVLDDKFLNHPEWGRREGRGEALTVPELLELAKAAESTRVKLGYRVKAVCSSRKQMHR